MQRDEQIRAAWLMIEPAVTADDRLNQKQPAVVSHKSAAELHGLGDADADVMEFIVARRKQSRLTDVRYRVAALAPEQWTLLDGLPVTTVLATIEDLAADHLDGGHLAGIVRDAVTTGRLDPDEAAAALRPYAHNYGAPLGDGSALLDRFLAEAGVPESTRRLSQRLPVNRDAAIAEAPSDLDPFRFVMATPKLMTSAVAGASVQVSVYYGAMRLEEFPIDLSTELVPVSEVDYQSPTPVAAIDGLAPMPAFALYPLAQQISDKVCAMYEQHSGQPSTRYHDLVDLVLIVTTWSIDAATTRTALRRESARRGLELPAAVASPASSWTAGYAKIARTVAAVPENARDVDSAL